MARMGVRAITLVYIVILGPGLLIFTKADTFEVPVVIAVAGDAFVARTVVLVVTMVPATIPAVMALTLTVAVALVVAPSGTLVNIAYKSLTVTVVVTLLE